MFDSHTVINEKEVSRERTGRICMVCEEGMICEAAYETEIEYKGERKTIQYQFNICDLCEANFDIPEKKSDTAKQIKKFKMEVEEKQK